MLFLNNILDNLISISEKNPDSIIRVHIHAIVKRSNAMVDIVIIT